MQTLASNSSDLAAFDRKYHLHPFTNLRAHTQSDPVVMMKGKGARLWDSSGKEYIDALAGLWCVNVGYGREELAQAMSQQARTLPYYHAFASMTSSAPAQLAERIIHLAPDRMRRVFFGNSGSDANDTAIKIVWYLNNALGRPRKKKIIARNRAYHGVSVASASLTGLDGVHRAFDLPVFDVLRLQTPHYYRVAASGISEDEFSGQLASELEAVIEREGAETIAAFIAEPVMGAGGVFIPPTGYFNRIQKILKDHDILFIADEVICGFGRLGAWFGSFTFGLDPDIMTIAKGITSGYQPLSGCMVSQDVYEALEKGSDEIGFFGHGYTYSSHPIPAAVALANLDLIEQEGLVANSAKVGAYLQQQLTKRIAPHPLVGDVRSKGLIGAVELSASKDSYAPFDPALGVARQVYATALSNGLISRALQDSEILALSPPLIITFEDVDEILDKLLLSLDSVCDSLISSGSIERTARNVA